jgi:hypothetical protein
VSRVIAIAALTLTGVTAAHRIAAQAPAEPPRRIAASSFATVEVHLNARPIGNRWYEEDAALTGPSRIAITYSQPHARGRKIIGGLVPTDTVWRFGANIATTLHTDLDIRIGSLAIPRGDYTLFMLHSATNQWQLIVSSQTAEWGTDYNQAKDYGRLMLAARAMRDNEETFTIYLVPDAPNPMSGTANLGGMLRIRWGTTELDAPWTVKP